MVLLKRDVLLLKDIKGAILHAHQYEEPIIHAHEE